MDAVLRWIASHSNASDEVHSYVNVSVSVDVDGFLPEVPIIMSDWHLGRDSGFDSEMQFFGTIKFSIPF